MVEEGVQVTGAEFELKGDLLVADLNIIWKNRVSAAIRVDYRLSWKDPNVVAVVEKATAKGVPLPKSMFADRVIPIGNSLPKALKIEKMDVGERRGQGAVPQAEPAGSDGVDRVGSATRPARLGVAHQYPVAIVRRKTGV